MITLLRCFTWANGVMPISALSGGPREATLSSARAGLGLPPK